MKTTGKPTLQGFHISGVTHISPDNALKELKDNNAVLIDVREENEVSLEWIPLPNVLNHPMSVIMDRLKKIAKDQHLIVICQHGLRSVKVANLLMKQGYPAVANLDGGLEEWKANECPYETAFARDDGCGCNCSSCGDEC